MKTIKNVIKLRKELYVRSLADKIARDTAQFNLKEAYKPLLEGQKQQTESQKEISETLQAVKSQDLTQKHEELISEIKKQPLIIPLIETLNKEPNIINVIQGIPTVLDEREQHILQQLDKVDDKVLKTLIDVYSEEYPPSYRSRTESMLSRSEPTEETQKAEEWFGKIMEMRGERNTIKRNRGVKNLLDEEGGKQNLENYLKSISYWINLSNFPYTAIKDIDLNLYKKIQEDRRQFSGRGFVKFLSSNPQKLFNKLNILMAVSYTHLTLPTKRIV